MTFANPGYLFLLLLLIPIIGWYAYEISLKSQAHMAMLAVTNEGDEIPTEKREHLFDRFYRINEARNSEGQHYGLGLPIAKAVAGRHHGNISVSCHDGKIRFEASFPVKKEKN